MLHRTRRRLNSVSIASSILDEEFNQIKAVLNVPKRPRIDIAGTSQENGVDGINYLVSENNFVSEIHKFTKFYYLMNTAQNEQ